VPVAREVVDVELDRGGAGVLHRVGVVGPAAGLTPFRLAITGTSAAAAARSSRLR
jgi:hypothetical protein